MRLAALAMGLAWGVTLPLGAQRLALTFDDGPKVEPTPLMSPEARNQALLDQLRRGGAQAMFFVTLKNGADRPAGLALLKTLSDGGQLLANHTVTHPDFNAPATSLAAFQEEILGCDRVISTLPGYRKFLRFPYLREGASEEKRDGVRTFLKAPGYRIGYVSIDTSDWLIDQKLCAKLAQDPRTDLAPWRAYYLAHLWERARIYDGLARGIYGRDLPHVLLLHHNLLNALFLGDVIALFRERGWTLVGPEAAYADPAYAVAPRILPLDGSVLETSAEALGLDLAPYFKGHTSERRVGEGAGRL